MNLDGLLNELVTRQGSDLHLKVGDKPVLRLKGELVRLDEHPLIESEQMNSAVKEILTPAQMDSLTRMRGVDFSYVSQQFKGRFRVNVFYQKNELGAVFRIIPTDVPSLEKLNLPSVFKDLGLKRQGLILVTGPTGSGKSTTLAALVNYINATRPHHIITIEDPIEFVHESIKAVINQREIGADAVSFSESLRQALRQDPDVILVGEMRDQETISFAVTAAETGHLVLSTLHTNDAKQSIDRILDTFPPDQQHQVRMQLANVLLATISQRLLIRKDGKGRVAAIEIMINSPTVKKMIEEGRTGAISKAIEESTTFYGMQSFNQSLFSLWKDGIISQEEALAVSTNPSDLKLKLQTSSFGLPPQK